MAFVFHKKVKEGSDMVGRGFVWGRERWVPVLAHAEASLPPKIPATGGYISE